MVRQNRISAKEIAKILVWGRQRLKIFSWICKSLKKNNRIEMLLSICGKIHEKKFNEVVF